MSKIKDRVITEIRDAFELMDATACVYQDGSYPCEKDIDCYACAVNKILSIDGIAVIDKTELPSIFNTNEDVMSALEYKEKLKDYVLEIKE